MKVYLVKIVERRDNSNFKTDLGNFYKEVTIEHMPQIGMALVIEDGAMSYFRIDDITQTLDGKIILFNRLRIFYRDVENTYPNLQKTLLHSGWKKISRMQMIKRKFFTPGYNS